MNTLNRLVPASFRRVAGVAAVALVSAPVFAAGPDFSSLTASVDFGTAVTAVISVGAAVALVYIAIRGVRAVLSAIRN